MQRNSRPPSKRRELASEQEAAEQEHRLADKNGGKYRALDANEGNEPARRCGYAYGERNVVESTAWKEDEFGNDRRKNCRRHGAQNAKAGRKARPRCCSI